MVGCMHKQIIKRVKEVIASSKDLALSCDEINHNWESIMDFYPFLCCLRLVLHICVHFFRASYWKKECTNNLIEVIMGALKEHGGIFNANIVAKLISFGVDGVIVFKGVCNRVTCRM